MTKENVFRKGEQITTLDELMKQEFVSHNCKCISKSVFETWELGLAKSFIDKGCLHYAIAVDDKDIIPDEIAIEALKNYKQ